MRKKLFRGCIGVSLIALSQGCMSTFNEHHYFRTVDPNGKPVNYFKIEISGGTFLSSSRYVSGYFDQQAVDTYFGEFTQPSSFNGSSGTTTTPTTPTTPATSAAGTAAPPTATPAEAVPQGQKVQSLDGPGLEGKKLTLLFSSNSDAIATQIGNLGQGNDVLSSLEQLLGKDQAAAQQKQQAQAQTAQAAATEVVNQGNTTIMSLDKTAVKQADAYKAALSYANTLAAYLGNKQPFPDLNAAKDWVEKSGYQIASEDKR